MRMARRSLAALLLVAVLNGCAAPLNPEAESTEALAPAEALYREGEVLETVWSEPGGVMTLEPLADGSFLATHRFYSPNDSAQASIVRAHREETGWQVDTLCPLPFVHRFGVLEQVSNAVVQFVEQYRQQKNPPESQAPETLPTAPEQTDPGPEACQQPTMWSKKK